MTIRKCKICGERFHVSKYKPAQRFCSVKCRMAAWRKGGKPAAVAQ